MIIFLQSSFTFCKRISTVQSFSQAVHFETKLSRGQFSSIFYLKESTAGRIGFKLKHEKGLGTSVLVTGAETDSHRGADLNHI